MPSSNKKKKAVFLARTGTLLRRTVLTNTSLIVILLLWISYSAIGPTGQTRFPIVQRSAINLGWVVTITTFFLYASPHFMYLFAKKNWPLAWAISLSTLIGAALCIAVSAATLYLPERVWIASITTFFGVGVQLALIVPIIFFRNKELFIEIALDVLDLNAGWYVPAVERTNSLVRSLPMEKRGTLISMTTKGGYVEIKTTAGTYLKHGSLKSMCELVPPDDGIRVHRSTWIRWDQIKDLHYRYGNPYISISESDAIPISRKSVASIKKYLSSTYSEESVEA